MTIHTKTLQELSHDLATKQYSSEEVTRALLTRIEKIDPQLNSFITVTPEHALAAAKAADQLRHRGEAGPLAGIPFAHKDIFCTQGIKTSCGSKMLDNFIAPFDATVTTHFKTAGMVLLGKTNMDEFAMGSSNETSFYGIVRNPWNLNKVPGGSSGGSAAAVAARLAPFATGTDTGGSIRQPAALCGITGLKPTYGRVSRYGMIAFASSLDQGGPMTQTAFDAAMVLNAMAGFDPRDSTCLDLPVPDYTSTLNDSIAGLKIGLPKEFLGEGLDSRVAYQIDEAVKVFQKMGAHIKEINLPYSAMSIPTYYVLASAECSSNLSRFDGVRYGYRCQNPQNLLDLYERSRGEGFGAEVKRRIMIGTYVLSSGFYDAYYLKSQKMRRLINDDFKNAFGEVDMILSPTTPSTAFALGEKDSDPLQMYLSDIYTIAVNLAGLPGISIPAGFVENLPVGMQLISPHLTEARLLNVAHQYQCMTDWHRRMPVIGE